VHSRLEESDRRSCDVEEALEAVTPAGAAYPAVFEDDFPDFAPADFAAGFFADFFGAADFADFSPVARPFDDAALLRRSATFTASTRRGVV
jgi:hypothetical protein